MFKRTEHGIFFYIMVAIVGLFLEAAILMWIWNGVFVSLFSLPWINYWQMFCIKLFVNLMIPTSSSRSE